MIRIIYDPQDLTSARENRVREISAYSQLVKSCLASLSEGKNQTIILAQPVLLQWFKNMSARYPQGTFLFEALDARLALAQRWGMAIPDSVAKEDILQVGVLPLDLHPQPGVTLEGTLLTLYYTPPLVTNNIHTSKLRRFRTAKLPNRQTPNPSRNMRYWRRHGSSTTYNDITVLTNINPERIPYAATNLCP